MIDCDRGNEAAVVQKEKSTMAKARMYGWAAKRFETPKKVAELKGQAAVVRDTLDRMTNEATDAATSTSFLAETVTEQVIADGKLVTRQDPARVVLYYLLILKKRGFIAATEQPVVPEAEDDDIELTEEELETIAEEKEAEDLEHPELAETE